MRTITAALFAALMWMPAPESKAMLFEWSGTCTFWCTGVAHAVFTVKNNYVPGTDFFCNGLDCPIIGVAYFDNTETEHFTPTFDALGSGRFPASVFDAGFLHLYFDSGLDALFFSGLDVTGKWAVFSELAFEQSLPAAQGVGGRFSTAVIPEPSSLALVALALTGLGITRRRLHPA